MTMEEHKLQSFEINILGVEMDATSKKTFCRVDAKYSCVNEFSSAVIVTFFKKYPETIPFFKQAIDVIENHPHIADLLKEVKP
jgi:hypothetical protein